MHFRAMELIIGQWQWSKVC